MDGHQKVDLATSRAYTFRPDPECRYTVFALERHGGLVTADHKRFGIRMPLFVAGNAILADHRRHRKIRDAHSQSVCIAIDRSMEPESGIRNAEEFFSG